MKLRNWLRDVAQTIGTCQIRACRSSHRSGRYAAFERLEVRALLSIYSIAVTTTADSGPGTLRQAILDANAVNVLDNVEIVFEIPETDPGFVDVDSALAEGDAQRDVFRIRPLSELPAIQNVENKPVSILGETQSTTTGNTNSTRPLIELDGSLAGAGVNGLSLNSDAVQVRGLTINRFDTAGIVAFGNNLTIAGNFIGTDAAGVSASPNGLGNDDAGSGIRLIGSTGTTIGGTNPEDRNLISGNNGDGISIIEDSAAIIVSENYIGIDNTGTLPLGNGRTGILLSDAHFIQIDGTGQKNVISGNEDEGILLESQNTNVSISGNYIGTNAVGSSPIANQRSGVSINDSNHVIVGGSAVETRNVIAGNLANGIGIGFSSNITMTNNYVGVDVTGSFPIPNGSLTNDSHAIRIGNDSLQIRIGGPGAGNV
ncbi:MAG TPA: right-handed parallel beta-helix repeat-containing protein, partial [Planctomycetaceae bacterium]|nr:right-handed parallel beta-helix repeat-containing protein [Planctomycetaceae bacterium]